MFYIIKKQFLNSYLINVRGYDIAVITEWIRFIE